IFSDPKVREALTLAFDFEWVNKNLFENAYVRTQSFWQNSDLSSLNVPASPLELQLLGEAKNRLSPEVLSGKYSLPVTDGSGRDRKVLRQAYELFMAAGYKIEGAKMRGADGTPLTFEILAQNQAQ